MVGMDLYQEPMSDSLAQASASVVDTFVRPQIDNVKSTLDDKADEPLAEEVLARLVGKTDKDYVQSLKEGKYAEIGDFFSEMKGNVRLLNRVADTLVTQNNKAANVLNAHSKDLKAHGKDLEAHGKNLDAHGKVLEAYGKDIKALYKLYDKLIAKGKKGRATKPVSANAKRSGSSRARR